MDIWQRTRYWEFALYDAVASEKEKSMLTYPTDWKQMTVEEQEEFTTKEQSIVFGQLGSFAMHMLSVGLTMDTIRSFISKQCLVNDLSPELRESLISTLPAMQESVLQDDREREIRMNGTEEAQEIDNALAKQQQLREQLEKLRKREEMLSGLITTCLEMKSSRWEERNVKLVEEQLIKQFDLLRDMLQLKQQEVLQNVRAKAHEVTENLDINTRELETSIEKIWQTTREINEVLQIQEPSLFLKTTKHMEKKQDARLKELSTISNKLNELMVEDMDIKPLANEIQKLHTKDRLSIARWKIPYMDSLKSGKEIATTFRLHGFNWKISIVKNSNLLAVFLDFLDSPTAVAWHLNTKFVIRLINQKDISQCHHHGLCIHPFGEDRSRAGYDNFMDISELFQETSGWVLNDTSMLEIELQDLEVLEHKTV